MNEATDSNRLEALILRGEAVQVVYKEKAGDESRYEPDSVRVSLNGIFLEWPDAPANIRRVRIEWSENPFMPTTFRIDCEVSEHAEDGIFAEFDGPAPTPLTAWFQKAASILGQRTANAAVQTSRLYTRATVVSAAGLFCGALAILLPILAGDQVWVDWTAKILLLLMVCSIGGFAWLRALAGRAEVRAIGQGE